MFGKLAGAWLGSRIAGRNSGAKGALLGYGASAIARRGLGPLLMGVLIDVTGGFGAAIGVRKNNHIQVDFLYRLLPRAVTRPLSMLRFSASAISIPITPSSAVTRWQ